MTTSPWHNVARLPLFHTSLRLRHLGDLDGNLAPMILTYFVRAGGGIIEEKILVEVRRGVKCRDSLRNWGHHKESWPLAVSFRRQFIIRY